MTPPTANDCDYMPLVAHFSIHKKSGSFQVKFERKISRIDSNSHKLVEIKRHIDKTGLNAIQAIKIWIENGGGSIEDLCTLWCKTLIDNKAVDDPTQLTASITNTSEISDNLVRSIKIFANAMGDFFTNPYKILEMRTNPETFLQSHSFIVDHDKHHSLDHMFVEFENHDHASDMASEVTTGTRHPSLDLIVFEDPSQFTVETIASKANVPASKAKKTLAQMKEIERQNSENIMATAAKAHSQLEEYIFMFVQVNAIFQLILDIVLEFLHLVPRRINHLSLTVVNAFLAWKTLSSIKQRKFKFLHEDIQILFVLELFLIFGDVFVLFDDKCLLQRHFDLGTFYLIRSVFLALSAFNASVSLYVIQKYKLYHCWYVGDHITENMLKQLRFPMLLVAAKRKSSRLSTRKRRRYSSAKDRYSAETNSDTLKAQITNVEEQQTDQRPPASIMDDRHSSGIEEVNEDQQESTPINDRKN